jgi:uncharacterized protein with GYD domain
VGRLVEDVIRDPLSRNRTGAIGLVWSAVGDQSEGGGVATYVVLVNWTDQGARGFDKTTERVDHEEEIRKRAGVELKEIYWTQGPYDLVAIIEAPDDESIAAAMLGVAAHGNSRTTTLRAYNRDEYERILAKLG